ncbi:MAG: phosphatase PAP2 family protein [Gemmatimonadota bacterium]
MSTRPEALLDPRGSTFWGRFWRLSRNFLALFCLIFGLVAIFLVSGWLVPSYLFILAVALPSATLALGVRDRADRTVWLAYILGFVMFAYLRGLADETNLLVRYDYVIALDRALFLGHVPTVWLQERFHVLGNPSAWDYSCVFLHFTYFFLPPLFALVLWRRDGRLFHRYVCAGLATYYVALLTSALLPTAPPWLAGQTGDLPHVYRIVEDILTGASPGAYDYAYAVAGTNPVAAMPSLHMAISCVIALSSWRLGRWPRIAGSAYAASMGMALVYSGEHYVIDIVAGVLLAVACWRWLSRPRASDREALPGLTAEGPA